jgi:hypothetical protein
MNGKQKQRRLVHHRMRRIDGHRVGYLTFNPQYKEQIKAQARAYIEGRGYVY